MYTRLSDNASVILFELSNGWSYFYSSEIFSAKYSALLKSPFE
jgi:hypothetical protein